MNLQNICIILSQPEEERNIGASCRAMANCDIQDLRIIGKKSQYNEEHIRRLALHAANIWENVRFFSSIKDATKDCTLVAGTTRRRGRYRKGKLFLPEEMLDFIKDFSNEENKKTGQSFAKVQNPKFAIVFGNERTGLTDSELSECTIGVIIPTSKTFPSLNLSHAVQIICYHLFRNEYSEQTGYTPLTLNRIDRAVSSITENLQKIGFFKIAGKDDMHAFWRNILSRAAVSESEMQYIEKIFSKAAGLSKKNAKILH